MRAVRAIFIRSSQSLMYTTVILSPEVINHGSKEESKGYEEESLQEQEDKGQEKEEISLLFQNTQIEIRAF